MILFTSYSRIPYLNVIVFYVIVRLVQYRIPFSLTLLVVVRVRNVGLLCHTAMNGYKKWCTRKDTTVHITFEDRLPYFNVLAVCYHFFISSHIAFPSLRL